ncbi:MAG: hypothetical protein ACI4GW_07170 [Lachnospiraceae bacterium]
MKNIIISILTILCFIPCNSFTSYATELKENSETTVYSAGLIKNYYISISASGKSLLFTGNTNCFETMKTVGIKSIVIQRSSDGSSWSDYDDNVSDMTKDNAISFSVSSKDLGTVTGGYYYRVTCKHYAKESGLFGSSESISNTSNSVWIT